LRQFSFISAEFQRFPNIPGNSTRHARDMELLPLRAPLPVAAGRTYSPIWGHETSKDCDEKFGRSRRDKNNRDYVTCCFADAAMADTFSRVIHSLILQWHL